MIDSQYNDLVLEVYDAALAPSRWPALLDKIAWYIGASGAIIFEFDRTAAEPRLQATLFSAAYDPTVVEAYIDLHRDLELDDQLAFERLSSRTDGIELISDLDIFDGRVDWTRRRNVRFLLRNGLKHRAAALLNKDCPVRDRFSIQFAHRRGPIDREELRRASLILPHVAKSLSLQRPLAEVRATSAIALASLDLLKFGVAIVNAQGFVVFRNVEFQRIYEEYNSLRTDISGRLCLSDSSSQKQFAALMHDLGMHGRFGARPRKEAVVIEQGGDVFSLCIEIFPLSGSERGLDLPQRGHVVCCLDSRRSIEADVQLMRQTFDLSKAEQKVLELVTNGLTNKEIADRVSRSNETVNSHVKAILSKTQCDSRTQLVRLAASFSGKMLVRSAS